MSRRAKARHTARRHIHTARRKAKSRTSVKASHLKLGSNATGVNMPKSLI